MQIIPPPNLPIEGNTKGPYILAITPARRAIGVAVVDRLGVEHTWLCKLKDISDLNEMIAKVRALITDILAETQPDKIVLEHLSPRKRTRTNMMLAGLIESRSASLGFKNIEFLERKKAIDWVCRKDTEDGKSNLRKAAEILRPDCRELQMTSIPDKNYPVEWDRTWGQVAAAVALALFIRQKDRQKP